MLYEFLWLRVLDRIRFQLCVLVNRCLNGTAPTYLADSLCRTADVDGRRRLRSSVSDTLVVAPTNRSTLGDRAFPRAWNDLPSLVRAASSLSMFRQQLETFLFRSTFQWFTSAGRLSFLAMYSAHLLHIVAIVQCPAMLYVRDSVSVIVCSIFSNKYNTNNNTAAVRDLTVGH